MFKINTLLTVFGTGVDAHVPRDILALPVRDMQVGLGVVVQLRVQITVNNV
jgi:hypothetical protein